MKNFLCFRNFRKVKITDNNSAKIDSNNLPVMTYSGAAYPYVPITRVETCVWSPIGPSFARPKSESFALKSCRFMPQYLDS